MNAFNMTCEAVEVTLPDYLDETLEAWVRTSVDEHLGSCLRCAGLVRDLRNIQRDAAALPDLVPARDLWPEIGARIGTPVVPLAPVMADQPVASESMMADQPAMATQPVMANQSAMVNQSARANQPAMAHRSAMANQTEAPLTTRPRGRTLGPMWMGVAAAALILVTNGTTYLVTVRSLRPIAAPVAAPNVASADAKPISGSEGPARAGVASPTIASVPTETPTEREPVGFDAPQLGRVGPREPSPTLERTPSPIMASRSPVDPVYENEVLRLQTIMTWRRAQLDPATAAIIDNNLRIIDAAIAQSREALRNDPANFLLSDKLTQTLDKKVELLRRAAMLRTNT